MVTALKKEQKKRLVLIDGHALLFRAYYAIPMLTAPDGRMMNAVFGFTSTLLSVIEELDPTHIAVAFDSKGPTFRKEAFEEYKANRTKPPDELIEQFGVAREVVVALNIPKFEWQGFEADDLIGTLAQRAKSLNSNTGKSKRQGSEPVLETVIVTGDMDAMQLVDDKGKVSVYVPGRRGKPSLVYGEEEVVEKLGIRNDQVIDMKGLAGDTSDNIPGIKGVGSKTAVRLLNEFGNLEGVYEAVEEGRADKVVGKAMLEKIKAGKEVAFKSRELARIIRDVPLEFDLDKCLVSGYDKEKTFEVFESLGFKSLMERLPKDEFEMSVQEALF